MLHRVLACWLLAALLGCLPPPIQPPSAHPERLALIAFYGPRTLASGTSFFILSPHNELGEDLANELAKDVVPHFDKQFHATWLPQEKVQSFASYAALRLEEDGDGEFASVPGLRPIALDDQDEALSALARDLDVDAVVLIRNFWSFYGSNAFMPHGKNAARILVVDRDGGRVWDQESYRESFHGGISISLPEPEASLPTAGNTALDAIREAVIRCVNDFGERWQAGRPKSSTVHS